MVTGQQTLFNDERIKKLLAYFLKLDGGNRYPHPFRGMGSSYHLPRVGETPWKTDV